MVFRSICKSLGADVMVTEFVSSEGIIRQDERTRKYTEFTDDQRPVGVQLFGADGKRMGEAARKIIDWKQPDFIDINFGCPVKKVVSRNGGSSLLKDCSVLASVASEVARAVGKQVPVTAKIRIGWDDQSINAPEVCAILENCGMQAISVHGRTRSQGYGGEANWEVIDECSRSVTIPVIGNGDLHSGQDIRKRRESTGVSGVMIGRSAMQNPWIFREARHYLQTGEQLPPAPIAERWQLIVNHCRLAIASNRYGNERQSILAMRSRLMTYCKGFPGARLLRRRLSTVASLMEIEEIAAEHMEYLHTCSGEPAAI